MEKENIVSPPAAGKDNTTINGLPRKVLLNVSNHPVETWSEEQKLAASKYGDIEDMPFPVVDEESGTDDIQALANEYINRIKAAGDCTNVTIHIMGEQTFLYSMLYRLQLCGYHCIASTTRRDTEMLPDGSRKVTFRFSRFREYENIVS